MSGPERREQLIDVARGVFAERGFEAATIEEIAEAAKVSKPIVYQHFGGKEGLYAVIVDRAVGDLTERITTGLMHGASRESAEASAAAFLAFIEEEEQSFRILLHDGPGSGPEGSLSLVIGEIAERTEKLLAAQFKDLGFDKNTAPMYARMLVGATALVGEWWLEERKPPRDEVARHIVNLMWNGFKNLERVP